eukprot:COSAG06_NODE_5059_length_3755_cov_2.121171_3_plen_194_part_00
MVLRVFFWFGPPNSRFTDEIFSGLISLIFTISAILDLYKIHKDGTPLLCSEDNHNATAFDELTRGDLLSIVNDEANTKELPCLTLLQLEAKVLVSVVLAGGTYMIAMQLRAYRKSEFTAAWLRNLLADFGVAIAIFAMVLVREFIFTTEVDLLNMPGKKTRRFAPFYTKNGSFCQDRLGTNTGKALKKRRVFL